MRASIVTRALPVVLVLAASPAIARDTVKPGANASPSGAQPLVVKPAAVRLHAPQAEGSPLPYRPRPRHDWARNTINNVR